ncbi:spore germination protein [Calorimonas adulescens]|jgi:Bacillus/Clostridium GerA spore germination protein.|uniref:Spore germination protein n=1 Tax=Calorimonas adulescens TaxID=2606906 RepID=A0A5D8QGF6_9THEO|nr:spore germination protein [Calorimonas adulescens]TZE82603.1 spore germination protein [Calorimonas adulescens]
MEYISKDLKENIEELKNRFKECDDIIFREFHIGNQAFTHKVTLIYFENMIDRALIQDNIIKPLTKVDYLTIERNPGRQLFDRIKEKLITAYRLEEKDNMGEIVAAILSGNTALFVDRIDRGIVIYSKGWEKRNIEEPQTEVAIRGAHEGFIESCGTNVSLIRKRIKDPNLKYFSTEIGKRSKTTVGLMYIDGIANPAIIDELKRRISKIDIDGILESGYIEQLIEDNPMSPFPQFRHTERPDETCGALLEGNVVILCDNTPYALIAPVTLIGLFQSIDDYSSNWYIATLIRALRFLSAFFAVTIPALYIASTSYHPDMLPTDLVLSIASSRENVPFATPIEALLMLITLEVLREAGVRLPAPFGQTIGIVGSIVLGQASVQAGIVSPIMVIIISINAISSFAIPNFNLAICFRLMTFIFILLASVAGLYGVYIGFLALIIHLVKLKSVGVSYLSPFVNFKIGDGIDTFYRAPFHQLTKRPDYTMPLDKDRMKKH